MLEKIDMKKEVNPADYNERMAHLEIRMGELQRKCKELGIPIMIVFEGFEASGKGTMINKMIQPLDPRGFKVYTMEKENEEEKMHPYFWRYFIKTPAKGRIHIFDRSWYQGLENGKVTPEDVRQFERQFTDDGMVVIKFFLAITKKEQKKRLKALEQDSATKWRVRKEDRQKNKEYDKYLEQYDTMLIQTDTSNAPWTVVEAMEKKFAICKIMTIVVNRLEAAVAEAEAGKPEKILVEEEFSEDLKNGVLQGIDLSLSLEPEEYKKKRKDLQKRLGILHNKMYLQRVPVVLAFEGWDAGGKGGAIKRITQCIDPRGYEVVPVSAPNDIEKAHHYLWRFFEKFPKDGHLTIFDRTWYGRVLVERIEGFATEAEWKRAYSEINNMEAHLVKSGAIVLKFWLHIDKDEQERRFRQRQETPEKQWKITDEDWRNREQWEAYEKAVDEMVVRTSTKEAPWFIIEANSKLYARIKILEIVVEALEKVLK
ncbi:MAG: phosphate--AMP phosphotransferase [Lachnospiraceae bacterium]|nr:phosphate--AMP phosphotransferase [Lachnospiraceae bacterium]